MLKHFNANTRASTDLDALGSEIEKLHQQYESQQSQSQALSSHSQAMLNLNHKLQTTVVRNNSKAIDLEMERIKADMARKQLEIVTVSTRSQKIRSSLTMSPARSGVPSANISRRGQSGRGGFAVLL